MFTHNTIATIVMPTFIAAVGVGWNTVGRLWASVQSENRCGVQSTVELNEPTRDGIDKPVFCTTLFALLFGIMKTLVT